jgi:nucleoside-diphosphate-sugar epimerase
MKYFVTGGTGFIGGHVVRQLRDEGHEVIALVRDVRNAPSLLAAGAILHQGDVTDKESMRTGMQGTDGVFHLAGWYKVGVRDKSPGRRINVDGTRNVLELMRELKIPKGVYTSTLAVNSDTQGKVVDEYYKFSGQHISEYDATKAEAHDIAQQMIAEGLPLVIVMPGVVYGPGDSSAVHDTLSDYLRRRLPMVPQQTAYAWGYIDDIARAHLLAMEKGTPGETYIIAGPVHTLIEGLDMAEKITGVPAPRLHPSPGIMKALARMTGVIEQVLPLPENFSSEYLRVAAGVTYLGDNSKARRELGYDPRPLEVGLKPTLEWEQAQLKK